MYLTVEKRGLYLSILAAASRIRFVSSTACPGSSAARRW
jgi:hypothetical protein